MRNNYKIKIERKEETISIVLVQIKANIQLVINQSKHIITNNVHKMTCKSLHH